MCNYYYTDWKVNIKIELKATVIFSLVICISLLVPARVVDRFLRNGAIFG